MFGTLIYGDVTKVRYGLNVLPDEKHENLLYQLKVPFDATIKRQSELVEVSRH